MVLGFFLSIFLGHRWSGSVLDFFKSGWILPNLNSNNIVLIPKFLGANKIEDFRAIALANFQFKIITKVLADKLSVVAAKIVSPQQRGFLKERHIFYCICLASEATNLLDHKTFGGNVILKLDIRKAFDTMDWDFLLKTLTAFGFNQKFTNWINVILNSAKLSVNVNGNSVDFFECKRGVRQGDPLSPLFFCIAEDVLSRGITNLVAEGKLSTISGPGNIKTTSHVLYADDVLVFCKGLKKEIDGLNQILRDYANNSGQVINHSKCKFYIMNASSRKVALLTSYLGFSSGSLPFNYLGAPLFKGKPRIVHLQPITDRIEQKLSNWKVLASQLWGEWN
ncbi:unnamed protein product [Lupinus luteus]|uniref:Reverse transcriptase domain-containing protein n=1 Tax=Lupinus luteus TaxID=3873 RepID=A0AAV1VRS5_LUPLU